jgi:hypothetical protein
MVRGARRVTSPVSDPGPVSLLPARLWRIFFRSNTEAECSSDRSKSMCVLPKEIRTFEFSRANNGDHSPSARPGPWFVSHWCVYGTVCNICDVLLPHMCISMLTSVSNRLMPVHYRFVKRGISPSALKLSTTQVGMSSAAKRPIVSSINMSIGIVRDDVW